jgi:hypothetical protein
MTSTTDVEIVAGELVLAEPEPTGPPTLFGTSNPHLALQRMGEVATALVDVIRDRKLVSRIQGRDHLNVEAWQTLGGMLGIVPVVVWTRPLEDGAGWEARVEARTLDGRVVGAAESMCTHGERSWRTRDEYALRGMSQTRAISRALRAPLSQIVSMAGYDPTAAEEMPPEEQPQPATSRVHPVEARPEQLAEIQQLLARLNELRPEADWRARCREITGGPPNLMTVGIANVLIDKLKQSIEAAEMFGPAVNDGSS